MSKSSRIKAEVGRWDGEKKLIALRERVNELHFGGGYSKNILSRRLGVSKKFVIRWTQSVGQDFSADSRGWTKGRGRRWNEEDQRRIKRIHEYLRSDANEFYCGATAVQQEWRKRYPELSLPPLRTIGEILSRLGLSGTRKRKKNKGAARYLCYPEHTIYELLGYRVLEADFVGKKFLSGCGVPLNFVGFSFKRHPRLRHFIRIVGETSANLTKAFEYFFNRFEKPDAVKVDNGAAAIGGNAAKRNLSQTMVYLLENRVIPIFSVPRKPFSQASIEGSNSVFSRKFWYSDKVYFTSVEDVDAKLHCFNLATEKYNSYHRPDPTSRPKKDFVPKVFFIRQVKEGNSSNGVVYILNEDVAVGEAYINYFVLGEWDLRSERLKIHFEKDQQSELIQEVNFPINYSNKRGSYQRFKRIKTL